MTAARLIQAAPPVAAIPGPDPIGSNRVEISPVARLRFDELRGRVAKIGTTMLATTATRAAAEQAASALAEIEQLAKAARVALGVKG